MAAARLRGIHFENQIQTILNRTRLKVYREAEVTRMYGSNITAVDHMLKIDGKLLICIQDKYQEKNISIQQTTHFIYSVNTISRISKMPCIGIYLTKSRLSGPSMEAFIKENKNNNKNRFVEISGETFDILSTKLSKYLHTQNIFMYDSEGDCFMQ